MSTAIEQLAPLCKIAFEDVQEDFGITENLWQKYIEAEIYNNEHLIPLINTRDSGNFDWVKETPLGGTGTTLNALMLYALIRHFDMSDVIETGVSGGYYSAFMLGALERNDTEKEHRSIYKLTSLEISEDKAQVGKLVPEPLKIRWNLQMGKSSLESFAEMKFGHHGQLYSHDSLHSLSHMFKELNEFKQSVSEHFIVFIDDQTSDGFWQKCLNTGAFKKEGYIVTCVSGAETRLHGHLGGFVRFSKK